MHQSEEVIMMNVVTVSPTARRVFIDRLAEELNRGGWGMPHRPDLLKHDARYEQPSEVRRARPDMDVLYLGFADGDAALVVVGGAWIETDETDRPMRLIVRDSRPLTRHGDDNPMYEFTRI
jgi:hypothetical protein